MAQQSLASELEPAISTLLQRSELYIAKLERKQESLRARSELLEGRLEGDGEIGKRDELRKKRSLDKLVRNSSLGKGSEEKALRYVLLFHFLVEVVMTDETELTSANRLKALRQKKERLGYAVERLNLQSQQRQRQLRMSVAATKD